MSIKAVIKDYIYTIKRNTGEQLVTGGDSVSTMEGSAVAINEYGNVVASRRKARADVHGGMSTGSKAGVVETRVFRYNSEGERGDGELIPNSHAGYKVYMNSSGNVMAVNSAGANLAAHAYDLYKYNSGDSPPWSEMGTIGELGFNVKYIALNSSGTRAIIGHRDDPIFTLQRSSNTTLDEQIGTVWNWTGSEWGQLGNVINLKDNTIDPQPLNPMINKVAINSTGDIVAITEPNYTDTLADRGRVTVWKLGPGDAWEQLGGDILGTVGSKYGNAMSLSGNGYVIAVGTGTGVAMGKVCRYKYSTPGALGGVWVLEGTIDGDTGDRIGVKPVSLSTSGNRISIGGDGDNSSTDPGYIKIYEYADSSFSLLEKIDYKPKPTNYGDPPGGWNSDHLQMSGDGSTIILGQAYNSVIHSALIDAPDAGDRVGVTSIYELIYPDKEAVTSILSGTVGWDAGVAPSVNGLLDNITSSTSDTGAKSEEILKTFSENGGFDDDGLTATKKRKLLKSLMRQVVYKSSSGQFTYAGGKAELMKFAPGLDNPKISDDILIVKAGETITQDMGTTSIYSPFEDGESVTINDSSNSDLLIVMGQEGDNYTLKIGNLMAPHNGTDAGNLHSIVMGSSYNQAGNVYEHSIGNLVAEGFEKDYVFVWGSGTAGGSGSGGASGDPYITTIRGTTYKMDDFTGTARMLQGQLGGKLFTLNAQTNLLTPGEITELINWRKDNLGSRQFKKHSEFAEFPAYFSKLSVTWGDDSFVIDINTLEIESATYDVVVSRGYSLVREYQWSDKKSAAETATISIGKTKLVVYSYENKDVRNGFTLNNASGVGNRSGALEHAIYTEDMKLSGLMSTKAITQLSTRESGKRTTSEQFLEGGVEQKTVEFNVY